MVSKKSKLIIALISIAFAGSLVYFVFVLKEKLKSPQKEETTIERQLRELDELRAKAESKPLTEEEIKKQLEELNKLRQSQ